MAVGNFKEYPYTTYWLEEAKEIVFIKYSPQLHITIEVAQALVKSRLEYTGNAPHYTVIDFTNVLKVDKAAREYMNDAKYGLKNIKGGAFLSNSIIGTFFINLYLKIDKPKIPARFFTNKADAVKWLQELKH